MTADHTEEPNSYIEASFDALQAAVRHHHGTPGALTDLDHALERLSGTTHALAHMGGWAAAVRHAAPDSTHARIITVDAHTGHTINPDGHLPPALLLSARLAVALLAEDYDNAFALWSVATDQSVTEQVLVTVLEQMAALLAPHIPAGT